MITHYQNAAAITVGTAFQESKAIWVGSAGNLTVTMRNGASVVFNSVPAGTLLPIVAVNVTVFSGTAGTLIALR